MTPITFTPPAPLMNMNERLHWRETARRAKAWRHAAKTAATGHDPQPPCWITVELPVRGRIRRDPANWYPTVKHIVDGLVDAGLWPDDTPEHVTTTEPLLTIGTSQVAIHLTPRSATATSPTEEAHHG